MMEVYRAIRDMLTSAWDSVQLVLLVLFLGEGSIVCVCREREIMML